MFTVKFFTAPEDNRFSIARWLGKLPSLAVSLWGLNPLWKIKLDCFSGYILDSAHNIHWTLGFPNENIAYHVERVRKTSLLQHLLDSIVLCDLNPHWQALSFVIC